LLLDFINKTLFLSAISEWGIIKSTSLSSSTRYAVIFSTGKENISSIITETGEKI
jgi:hypothetical protein